MVEFENLSGKALTDYLAEHPEAVSAGLSQKLDKNAWARLLIKSPQLSRFCPWHKLDGTCWVRVLKQQPQFAGYCRWEKLNSANWGDLVRFQPVFADFCPWQALVPADFAFILQKHPHLLTALRKNCSS